MRAFARHLETLKGRLGARAKGPVVCQGIRNTSAGDAKGYLANLDKTQGPHDKTLEYDDLG